MNLLPPIRLDPGILAAAFILIALFAGAVLLVRRDVLRRRWQRQMEIEKALVEVADSVRRGVGIALHDGLSHDILNIAVLFQLLVQKHPQLPVKEVAEIEAAFKETVFRTKRLARSLFPLAVEGQGFPFFLEELAARAEQRYGIECQREIQTGFSPEDAEVLNQLQGIALEATFNAIRHSGTKRIRVSWMLAAGRPLLCVRDWGSGIEGTPRKGHSLGLKLMKFRARMIGAEFSIRIPPGGGTEVSCILPAAAPTGKDHEQ